MSHNTSEKEILEVALQGPPGPTGPQGPTGPPGPTGPAGGLDPTLNLSDLNHAPTARTNLGLGNVDNTADADKPVSTAQQAAIDAVPTGISSLSEDPAPSLSNVLAANNFAITSLRDIWFESGTRLIQGSYNGVEHLVSRSTDGRTHPLGITDTHLCQQLQYHYNPYTLATTGSAITPQGYQQAGRIGVFGVYLNSNTDSGSIGAQTRMCILSGDPLRLSAWIRTGNTLPSASEDFTLMLELGANGFNAAGNHVRIQFNKDSSAWQLTAFDGTTSNLADTVAVNTTTWYLVEILATSTSLEGFVNGRSIGSLSSNIPTDDFYVKSGAYKTLHTSVPDTVFVQSPSIQSYAQLSF